MVYTEVIDRCFTQRITKRWSRTVVAHGSLLYHCPAASLELNFDPCFSMRTAEMKLWTIHDLSFHIIYIHLYHNLPVSDTFSISCLMAILNNQVETSSIQRPRAKLSEGPVCETKSWGPSSYFLDHKILVKPPKNHGTWVCMLQKISCTMEKLWKNCESDKVHNKSTT